MGARKSVRNQSGEQNAGSAKERAYPEDPSAPASEADRQRWKGFCEIESEPAFFNVMLRSFGVDGVKVQEVFSLDDEMLLYLPWVEEDLERQEQSCPDDVWFANQTVNNACASVALLNIVNNIPELELGDNLKEFKAFTSNFSPALRGDAIGNFDFVKGVHNSFARKMDMLNADLFLKNEAASKRKKGNKRNVGDDDESGFHFIAFMPIHGNIWKLDGLERQPTCLRPVTGDWIDEAKPDILARMAQYEEHQIEFAMLSLVRDPLSHSINALASNVKGIIALSARLDMLQSSETARSKGAKDQFYAVDGADPSLDLTGEGIEKSELPEQVAKLLVSDSVADLLACRDDLILAQPSLRMAVQEGQQTRLQEEEKANSRRFDLGGRMSKFARKVRQKSSI